MLVKSSTSAPVSAVRIALHRQVTAQTLPCLFCRMTAVLIAFITSPATFCYSDLCLTFGIKFTTYWRHGKFHFYLSATVALNFTNGHSRNADLASWTASSFPGWMIAMICSCVLYFVLLSFIKSYVNKNSSLNFLDLNNPN